jgi:hypothetical protein
MYDRRRYRAARLRQSGEAQVDHRLIRRLKRPREVHDLFSKTTHQVRNGSCHRDRRRYVSADLPADAVGNHCDRAIKCISILLGLSAPEQGTCGRAQFHAG